MKLYKVTMLDGAIVIDSDTTMMMCSFVECKITCVGEPKITQASCVFERCELDDHFKSVLGIANK